MRNEKACGEKQQYAAGGKKVLVYPSFQPDRPVIYLNTFAEESGRMYAALRGSGCPDFTLAAVSGLDWDHDMAPWDIPPISADDTPCTGGADDYMRLLTDEIVPKAEASVKGRVPWRGLAGYSLAGLFAVYAMYHTEIFARTASVSGSLWFPGFAEYVFSHELKRKPEYLYFSLGDRESMTANPYLKAVGERTEEIERFYRNEGIRTAFQLNPGGHHKNPVQRTAAGIAWILGSH